MSDDDREIQERARSFVDTELIPHEVEAELHGGRLSDDLRERHHRMAIELGLWAMNMPKELGGGGLSMFQQVLVSEQLGRVTNALGWCVHTPAAWAPAVVTPEQLERWIVPTIRGERHECYAITEEGAGSDVDAIASTARRDGDAYVLERHEDARHLVQLGRLPVRAGQDRRRAERGFARDVLRRQGHARGPAGPRARVHPHLRGHARGRGVRGRPRPGGEPGRRRG